MQWVPVRMISGVHTSWVPLHMGEARPLHFNANLTEDKSIITYDSTIPQLDGLLISLLRWS
jgi:hypothetical protein